MKAFHNDPAVKEFYLARVRAHAAADEIIHGRYWENGKGCAVGCTIHGWRHRAYEDEIGVPEVIGRLEDAIFEGLQYPHDKAFPERFLAAIPVGADLSKVWPKFAVWLLTDPEHGVIQFTDDAHKPVIQRVADWYSGPMADMEEILVAEDAARAASESWATRAAACSAELANGEARAAARATAFASASAARVRSVSESFIAQANKLISLLEAA